MTFVYKTSTHDAMNDVVRNEYIQVLSCVFQLLSKCSMLCTRDP